MRQKLTLITLGVRNFQKALSFYEGLGWQKSDKSMDDYALFPLGGIVLGLYPLEELSADTGLPYEPSAFAGMTISYNATSEAEVDSVLAKVKELEDIAVTLKTLTAIYLKLLTILFGSLTQMAVLNYRQ